MQLGKGCLSDGTYSGFVVQKQGLPYNQTAKIAFLPAELGANVETSDHQTSCNISAMSFKLPLTINTSNRSSCICPCHMNPGTSSDTIDPTHFQGSFSYAESLLLKGSAVSSIDGTSERSNEIDIHGLVEILTHTDKDVSVSAGTGNSAKPANTKISEKIMRTSTTPESADVRESQTVGGTGSNSGEYGTLGYIL
jgi:hypothetical protein